MPVMDIILVRHGQTRFNREERVQGRSDAPLDSQGVVQATLLARRLKAAPVRAVYSSPLRRAVETAAAIAREHDLSVEIEDGLIEMDVGELDGVTFQELRARHDDLLKAWRRDAGAVRMPRGETALEVQARAWPVVQRAAAAHPQGAAVVVSHAFALQALICKALGLPLAHLERVRHDVAALSILRFQDGNIALAALNDRCHLLAHCAAQPG